MNKFDFTKDEYDYIIQQCPFTDEECKIFDMRRNGNHTVEQMADILFLHPRTVKRRIESINRKISRVI